jgi:hypothetical protein
MKKKMTIELVFGMVLAIVGIVLLFLGFYAPVVGEISGSVLTAYGEVSTFAGALIGIDYTYKFKMFKLSKDEKKENEGNNEN